MTKKKLKTFILGNCLRGCFEGDFTSQEKAWKILSARFLMSYPAREGRSVLMWVHEENQYGMMDTIKCQVGVTSLAEVSPDELSQCRYSTHLG